MRTKPFVRPYVRRDLNTAAERLNGRRLFKKLKRLNRGAAAKLVAVIHAPKMLRHITAFRKISRWPFLSPQIKRRIPCKNFSLLDDPIATLELLGDIAAANSAGAPYFVDFLDDRCPDVGAFLVLGLMRQAMRRDRCHGGKITQEVQSVICGLNLNRMMAMRFADPTNARIFPLPLIEQPGRMSRAPDFSLHQSAKEKACRKFVEAINGWLANVDFELTRGGVDRLTTLLGEVLDNTRHARESGVDAPWWMAGFMSEREDGACVCHLAILSLGRSFSQSLKVATKPAIVNAVQVYVKLHESASLKCSSETLRTVVALSDGVSCTAGDGGCGMSRLVDLINELGRCEPEDRAPRMTIISGRSCVMLHPPYNMMVRSDRGSFAAFNLKRSLSHPPDSEYAHDLAAEFPGTIVSLRFVLDHDSLRSNSGEQTNG